MVALKGKAIDGALARRNTAFHAVLIYGPDQGLVRERAKRLTAQIVSDTSDPFNYMELGEPDLKADPSRLSDEISALSFMGGERVIRVKINGEAAGPAITGFLDTLDKGHLKPNGIVIVEGGDLSPRSTLRKGFEKSKMAASMPCYVDNPAAVRAMAQKMATDHGLTFDNDALSAVVASLGEDRGLSRTEIEKLLFYKSPGPSTSPSTGPGNIEPGNDKPVSPISLADVRACLVDGGSEDLDAVSGACADGAPGPLAAALFRCASAGTNPVTILRALQRTFARIEAARQHMDRGDSPNDAMKKLRPPVFFGEQDAFRGRLNQWSTPKLEAARRRLIEAELMAKTTGNPQRELVERTAFQLCALVRR